MRLVTALAAALLSAGLLAGCTSTPAPDDGARLLAARLATGLAAKSLTGVPLDAPGADLTTLLGDLSGVPVTVTVDRLVAPTTSPSPGSASPDSTSPSGAPTATASATLAWVWDLGQGHTWTYTTDVGLERLSGTWTVEWAPTVVEPSLHAGETLAIHSLLATRGDILGGDGQPLVRPRPVVHYGLDKTRVAAAAQVASARRIAAALGIGVASYVQQVRAAGPKAFVEAIVLRLPDAKQVPASYADIPGAVTIGGTLPLAPTKGFAAPILGTVGPATAEIVQASGGAILAGDVVGLSGLQLRYDAQLRGTPGREVQAVDAQGLTRRLYSYQPVAGKPLRLTLDQALQEKAEQILSGVGTGTPPNASALVAIRPSTGAVLAAANGPGTGGQDIATFGQYAPGSTFKVVSSLALLRSGLTPQSRVSCPPTTMVDGKRFKNYDDYPASGLGTITLEEAVANSCNTAFVGQHTRLSGSDLADAAASLGLGVDHDTGFPSYFGQVPAPASETEAAADMIGQGKVLASPLAMATVAASVAAGHTVVPELVDGVQAAATPAKPLTAREDAALKTLMRAVVTEGSGHLLAGLSGQVGAKTGTAEYGTATTGSLPTHAWMIATRGDLAVAVFVETGDSGSGTAGPLLLRFLS